MNLESSTLKLVQLTQKFVTKAFKDLDRHDDKGDRSPNFKNVVALCDKYLEDVFKLPQEVFFEAPLEAFIHRNVLDALMLLNMHAKAKQLKAKKFEEYLSKGVKVSREELFMYLHVYYHRFIKPSLQEDKGN